MRDPRSNAVGELARLRVGYVLKVFPRLSQTFILTEILALERAGLDLTLFSMRRPKAEPEHPALSRVRAAIHPVPRKNGQASMLGAAVLRRAARVGREGAAELDEAEREPPEVVAQALWLAAAVERAGLTHLHAHFATSAAATARLAARWSGVSFSFTAHARDIFHQSVCGAALRQRLADAAFTVTVSEFNARHLIAIHGEAAARVEVVRNGLDLLHMPYSQPEARDRRIVAVGRLVEKKGFDDLLDACRILVDRGRSFRCEIIGDGPLGARLQAKRERLGLEREVAFLGPLRQDQVFEAVTSAALLVVPCRVAEDGDRDGLPTVLLEAMALGTPCVATAVTGIPEVVIDGESGLLAPARDPLSLADACARLLLDEPLGCRLAARARAVVVERHDVRKTSRELAARFAAATAGSHRAP